MGHHPSSQFLTLYTHTIISAKPGNITVNYCCDAVFQMSASLQTLRNLTVDSFVDWNKFPYG